MFRAMEKETLNGLKNDFCNSMVLSDLKYKVRGAPCQPF
jgi:hypothetical protein